MRVVQKFRSLPSTRSIGVTLMVLAFLGWLVAVEATRPVTFAPDTTNVVPNTLPDRMTALRNEVAQEHRARVDMFVHAVEHEMATESERRFGPVAGFDAGWNLYSADVTTADGTVTLYTAVNRDEPLIRYTASWDSSHGYASSWEPVLW